MYLREKVMDPSVQVAFFVTLAHNEFCDQVELNLIPETETLDSWLPFIMQQAVKLSVPEPRINVA